MKYLFLLFITLPAFAGPLEDCQKDVARIRNTPAKLITVAEWDKMLRGCNKPEQKKAPPKIASDDGAPEFISDAEMDRLLAQEAAAKNRAVTAELIRELIRENHSAERLLDKQMNATDAQINRLHEDAQATQRALNESPR